MPLNHATAGSKNKRGTDGRQEARKSSNLRALHAGFAQAAWRNARESKLFYPPERGARSSLMDVSREQARAARLTLADRVTIARNTRGRVWRQAWPMRWRRSGKRS